MLARVCWAAWLVPLPCFGTMRRSPEQRHVLTHILRGAEDVESNFNLTTWHAPRGKEAYRILSIVVPTSSAQTVSDATINPRRIPRVIKSQVNFISYDTEAQRLTVRLSLARFNASKRTSGASVGKPPDGDPPGPPAPPGRPKWKYSLLGAKWVPWSTPAPTWRELRVAFPGLSEWVHW